MSDHLKFNRMELAGSLGDLGTLLPIAIAMILLNGLNPLGLFFSVGLFYILSGSYFGVPVPVQPMKVIGAYAIATTMSASQILSSSLLMAIILFVIGITGIIEILKKVTPIAVVRGIQLSTGVLLIIGGIRLILGNSRFQSIQNSAEPYLRVQHIGPVPLGIILGIVGGLTTLLLLKNKKFPAGLVVLLAGLLVGLILGTPTGLKFENIGFHLPEIFPYAFPEKIDFTFALLTLVLPQLPMTMGNAVLAYTDLSKTYFGENSKKVTNRSVSISMALANFLSFCLGGMPLCHGAGGLAAHYRFGARTAGSNLIIGSLFLGLALLLGNHIVAIVNLIPMSILGVLLIFAGSQLALAFTELDNRKDFFIALLILGITLASNMAAGFIIGIVFANVMKWKRLSI